MAKTRRSTSPRQPPGRKAQHGARNQILGRVSSIKKGDIMSLIKVHVTQPGEMSSVVTTESLQSMGLKVGDTVELMVKAVHVLPVKI